MLPKAWVTRFFIMAERLVILSAKRERIRIPPEMERIATGLKPLAMTGRQFSVHPTVFAATKPLVILSARRERIRNSLKKRNGLPQPLHGFAMTGYLTFSAYAIY